MRVEKDDMMLHLWKSCHDDEDGIDNSDGRRWSSDLKNVFEQVLPLGHPLDNIFTDIVNYDSDIETEDEDEDGQIEHVRQNDDCSNKQPLAKSHARWTDNNGSSISASKRDILMKIPQRR